jgi:hypothetical protein
MVNTILAKLPKGFSGEGLTMADFILHNIAFSKEYAALVEQRQVAQQQAE